MNECLFFGRLTDNVELSKINGKSVAKFSLSIKESWKDDKGEYQNRYDFLDFEIWGPRAEVIAKAKKGDFMSVSASAKLHKWQREDGDTVRKIIFSVKNFSIATPVETN